MWWYFPKTKSLNQKTSTASAVQEAEAAEEKTARLESTSITKPLHRRQQEQEPTTTTRFHHSHRLQQRHVWGLLIGFVSGVAVEWFLLYCFNDARFVKQITRSLAHITVFVALIVVVKCCLPGYYMSQILCASREDLEKEIVLYSAGDDENEIRLVLINDLESPFSCPSADQEHCKVRSSSFKSNQDKLDVPLLDAVVKHDKEQEQRPSRTRVSSTCILLELLGIGFIFGMTVVAIFTSPTASPSQDLSS